MKKVVFLIFMVFLSVDVFAADVCKENRTLVACVAGYYKGGTEANPKCVKCPSPGTSADRNTGGIDSCYIIPVSGKTYEDDGGYFTIDGDSRCDYEPPSE